MENNDTNEIRDALNNLKPEFTVKKVTDIKYFQYIEWDKYIIPEGI